MKVREYTIICRRPELTWDGDRVDIGDGYLLAGDTTLAQIVDGELLRRASRPVQCLDFLGLGVVEEAERVPADATAAGLGDVERSGRRDSRIRCKSLSIFAPSMAPVTRAYLHSRPS